MKKQIRRRSEINQAIQDSAGRAFLDREHGRSFSLNIFRTNAVELIEALRHLSDPEHGLHLMAQDNREAGTQAHREVSRRIHNYVAAAKSLVDHTRVFMNENYANYPIIDSYNREIKARFQENSVAKFVHDLRNYMLHRGLPNSQMFVRYSQDPKQPDLGAQITTGVSLDAKTLREWGGWTAPARAYLGTVENEVCIEYFASAYLSQVESFQNWISEQLAEFHAADLAELDALREEYNSSEQQEEGLPHIENIVGTETPDLENIDGNNFYISSAVRNEINTMGEELVRLIRKLTFPLSSPQSFKSDRPVSAVITPDNILDQPVIFREDASGHEVVSFIYKDNSSYGFDAEAIDLLHKTLNTFLTIPWANRGLSEKFLQTTIIDWCRRSFNLGTQIGLTDAIISISRKSMRSHAVWAPIAHLEIEDGFSFGPVQIHPITANMIDTLESDSIKYAPKQEIDVRALFDRLRNTMQGYAAVVINLDAATERAGGEGLAIAREAVDLLRFFSPAAADATLYCPTCLLGDKMVPTTHVLVLGDGSFSYTENGVPPDVAYWRMSKVRLAELRQAFAATGKLIQTEYLDEFELSIRSSMILFGTASTLRELSDRLIYTLSAVEGILLKHELEPTAYSIEKRMSQILELQGNDPNEVSRAVRAIYRLRTRHGSLRWSDFERDLFQNFVSYAQRLLVLALDNVSNFSTRAEFIEAIERIRKNN